MKKKRKPDETIDQLPGTVLPGNLQVFIDNCDQGLNVIEGRQSNTNQSIKIKPDQLEITAFKFTDPDGSPPNKKLSNRLLVDDPLIPLGITVPDGVTIVPVNATPDHARDIAIVNNFFSNQLWKPEYIGALS